MTASNSDANRSVVDLLIAGYLNRNNYSSTMAAFVKESPTLSKLFAPDYSQSSSFVDTLHNKNLEQIVADFNHSRPQLIEFARQFCEIEGKLSALLLRAGPFWAMAQAQVNGNDQASTVKPITLTGINDGVLSDTVRTPSQMENSNFGRPDFSETKGKGSATSVEAQSSMDRNVSEWLMASLHQGLPESQTGTLQLNKEGTVAAEISKSKEDVRGANEIEDMDSLSYSLSGDSSAPSTSAASGGGDVSVPFSKRGFMK